MPHSLFASLRADESGAVAFTFAEPGKSERYDFNGKMQHPRLVFFCPMRSITAGTASSSEALSIRSTGIQYGIPYMPLTPADADAFQDDLYMGVVFAMFADDGRVVGRVTKAALEDRSAKEGRRETAVQAFRHFRSEIEAAASQVYDEGLAEPVIESEDLTPIRSRSRQSLERLCASRGDGFSPPSSIRRGRDCIDFGNPCSPTLPRSMFHLAGLDSSQPA